MLLYIRSNVYISLTTCLYFYLIVCLVVCLSVPIYSSIHPFLCPSSPHSLLSIFPHPSIHGKDFLNATFLKMILRPLRSDHSSYHSFTPLHLTTAPKYSWSMNLLGSCLNTRSSYQDAFYSVVHLGPILFILQDPAVGHFVQPFSPDSPD